MLTLKDEVEELRELLQRQVGGAPPIPGLAWGLLRGLLVKKGPGMVLAMHPHPCTSIPPPPRLVLRPQGRIIEQQQGTIRLLEDHLTAASSNSRRLPATAGPARSLSSFDALAAVSSLGTLGEPLGELSGAEQPQDPRLKLTVGPGERGRLPGRCWPPLCQV